MENRIEKDSFGPIEVPAGHLWGAQTQRSLHHFHISTERMAPELVAALAQVKRAAAAVNRSLGKLPRDKADAIIAPPTKCSGALSGRISAGRLADRFRHPEQHEHERGAGQPRSELMGGERGEARLLHPNDHVNMGQSSNDIFPTAMHVAAALAVSKEVLPALARLRGTLQVKARDFADIVKIGRTHLQDATP
jgi:fumarate hydratase class II